MGLHSVERLNDTEVEHRLLSPEWMILDPTAREYGVEVQTIVVCTWTDVVLYPSNEVTAYVLGVVWDRLGICIDAIHNPIEELILTHLLCWYGEVGDTLTRVRSIVEHAVEVDELWIPVGDICKDRGVLKLIYSKTVVLVPFEHPLAYLT